MVLKNPVWLIGGTQESAWLATELRNRSIACVVTVTTPTAQGLYPRDDGLKIWVGKLTVETLPHFLIQHQIRAIVDASHPFAIAISELAIATAQTHKIPYLRYERPSLSETAESKYIIWIDSYSELFQKNILDQRRVLLVLGYRPLPQFQAWQSKATLFARILPSPIALETALHAGFSPHRIIALRPPIDAALENALWQQWKINLVVAKASGNAGGEVIKRQLATQLRIPLVLIKRPPLKAPALAENLTQVLDFIRTSTPQISV